MLASQHTVLKINRQHKTLRIMRSQHPKFVMWDAAHEKSCNIEQCSSKWRGTVLSKSRQFDLATLTNTTDLQTVSFSRTVHSVFPNSLFFFFSISIQEQSGMKVVTTNPLQTP